MWEEAGKSEILYAGRLLRYYYLVKEKAYHPHKTWKEMQMRESGLLLKRMPAIKNCHLFI